MARRAPRREQVTVAELLGRSDAPRDRYRDDDTVVFPRARHREKPQVLRSLTRLRMLSVVAGALALTGGVSAAVSMPAQHNAGGAGTPAGLEPPAVALVPLPADVVVPAAKPAQPSQPDPESVAPPAQAAGIAQSADAPESNSVSPAVQRGKLARAVKVVDKVKESVKAKPKPPEQAAPVRHEIPDIPVWSRGRPGTGNPDGQAIWGGRRPAGFPVAARRTGGFPDMGRHHCGGGGRHRR
ncbi:hypothetical protein SAMN04489727_8119 [Amycolatopsis tolypomycina]|uniref:Uncharacterized protein n=1 Tax=Amycolatopsis tolypomycina TaxID=208445 RepID=A0A1H5B7V2_9PSEU|nr:hypothetical protein [Amycolatopsis tolypomycina]SED50030.1 hypothetical protein SAMN04489727_8119 [Amycolatopsis tolypomycina]